MYKGEDLHISERQLEFQQIYIVSRNCENIMIETLIDAYFLEENIGLEACFKIKGRSYILRKNEKLPYIYKGIYNEINRELLHR